MQENVEQYHRLVDAFNRRDLDALLGLLDPDVDFAPRTVALESGRPYRGHDGVRTWLESTFAAFSDYVLETEEVRDLGEMTFSRLRLRGHGMESGRAHRRAAMAGRRVATRIDRSLAHFRGEAEALEAAGLSE